MGVGRECLYNWPRVWTTDPQSSSLVIPRPSKEDHPMTRLLQTALLLLITCTPLFATTQPSNLFSARQTSSECADPPRNNCAFYADCLESRYHCGSDGYPIGYGQEFCEKFVDAQGELSARGQTWMLDVMRCLQRTLVPEATGSLAEVTCDSIEKKAFASHAPCYVESGLCWLPPTDWLAIVHIVGLETLVGSKDALIEALEAGGGCLAAYLFFLKHLG